MKCLFFLLICFLLFSCTSNDAANENPDYGLLILQKRIDSLEKRVNYVDSSIKVLNATRRKGTKGFFAS